MQFYICDICKNVILLRILFILHMVCSAESFATLKAFHLSGGVHPCTGPISIHGNAWSVHACHLVLGLSLPCTRGLGRGLPLHVRVIAQQLMLQVLFSNSMGSLIPVLWIHSLLSVCPFAFIDPLLNSVSFALPLLLLLLLYWQRTRPLLLHTDSRDGPPVHHFDSGCVVCGFRCD